MPFRDSPIQNRASPDSQVQALLVFNLEHRDSKLELRER